MLFNDKPKLQLHISVFLFGFTGILGDLISLNGQVTVWHRVVLTTVTYLLVLVPLGKIKWLGWRATYELGGIGLLLSLHWIFFFEAIRYSNVSVALICLASTTFMTALLEPWMLGGKVKRIELALGAVVIAGIYLIHQYTPEVELGVILGLISALLAAVMSVLNKKVVDKYPRTMLNFYELGISAVVLSAIVPLYKLWVAPSMVLAPTTMDWLWLVLLAVVCTNFAYELSIASLKHLSTFEFVLAINLEPIYGIILSIVLLNEATELNWAFYVGASLVLLSVFYKSLLTFQRKLRESRRKQKAVAKA